MDPIVRGIWAALGGLLGAGFASDQRLFGGLVGVALGLLVAEVLDLRGQLAQLRRELRGLGAPERRTTRPAALHEAAQFEPTREPPREVPPQPPRESPPKPLRDPPREAPPQPPYESRPHPPRPAAISPRAELPQDTPLHWIRDFFTGGNALVRGGIVVLFFGVAFLLRYLAEHTHVPIQLRLVGVASGAIVLLGIGWRLRHRRRGYALALQGGAVGILYLTVFSALRLYALLSPATAFVLMSAVSGLCIALAVLQDAQAVAFLAVSGGFLAPFLASTGTGNPVVLFSYFAVLNAVIVAVAWFRTWREINLAGFAFTFVLSSVWGVLQYTPREFARTEPFLALFFVFYVIIAILFSTRPARDGRRYLDRTLVFATPLAAFGLQAGMLSGRSLALGNSALVVGGFYLALSWLLRRRLMAEQRLVESFQALGVAFLTLAAPLALDARWSACSWALEGAALVWVGCRQSRWLPRAAGVLLLIAAALHLVLIPSFGTTAATGVHLAALIVGMASVYAALLLHLSRNELLPQEEAIPSALFLWGALWWCIGGALEIERRLPGVDALAPSLGFATATALLSAAIARRWAIPIARRVACALAPVMIVFALYTAIVLEHPFQHAGWLAWPLAFAGLYFIVWREENALAPEVVAALHVSALWLLTGIVSWELAWRVGHAVGAIGAWSAVVWGALPAVVLSALPSATARIAWPFRAHPDTYVIAAAWGLALSAALWSVAADVRGANPSAPLGYLPLLNPLDVTQGFVLFALVRFWIELRSSARISWTESRATAVTLTALGFCWLNALLLRTIHLWTGVPYELDALYEATLVQTALSIFWALLALAAMLMASRRGVRAMWLAGAGLLAVVVVKLFLVDLASIGTIERIVSFVGVGLLMLILGYFSPLPPATRIDGSP